MLRDRVKAVGMVLCMFIITACGGGGGGSTTPNASVSQSAVDFTEVLLDHSDTRIIEIKNTGNGNLTIGSIGQPTLPFSVSNDSCSNKTLGPSKTCTLYVNFSPKSEGQFTATFSVPSNDPDTGAAKISLKGSGYGLNAWMPTPSITGTCPGPVISVDVSVTDSHDDGLNSLTLGDFTLYENGKPIDPSTITFTNLQANPVSVVLALDMSESVQGILPSLRFAASSFIDLLADSDEAAICKFDNLIEFNPISSPYFIFGDAIGKTALKTYINNPYEVISGTRVYDAVSQSIDRAALGNNSKRAVIVLSDGSETSGINPSIVKTIDDVIANAKQKGIPVFTIFYVDPNFAGGSWGNTQLLQRLATETGGQYYNSLSVDLSTILRQISSVLSNKYNLSYTSSNCTGTSSLSVNVNYNGLSGHASTNISFP